MEDLGGYLAEGNVGPTSLSPLIAKISAMGPTPIIGSYYDLSYGRKPKIMLIIDEPTISAPVLEVRPSLFCLTSAVYNWSFFQNSIRWMGPKTPPYKIKQTVPDLTDDLLDVFLPSSLTKDQKQSERKLITAFVTELNTVIYG